MTDEDVEKLDASDFNEAIDRVRVMMEIFDKIIVEHHAVKRTLELKQAADAITGELAKFYQLCGHIRFTTP